MALVHNSQVFSSFPAIKSGPYPKIMKSRSLKISASEDKPQDQKAETDPVKLAFLKAKAYKKEIKLANDDKVVPLADKLALDTNTVQERSNKGNGESDINALPKKSVSKKEKLTISSSDFVGLGFSDKKQSRGLPAGLVPIVDSFPEGNLPDVEILVGDTTNFVDTETSKSNRIQEDDTNTYKPKISTWGVFPRPNDISKAFGGGRTLRPGEALESAEEKAAKEARTRELLAAYKKRVGLSIDPNIKLECEKALKDGDSFMDLGKLREALPFYEKVMNELPFQTELHGLAALQWSICQDSLRRSDEARLMYEKLQSHPNGQVSKKARQFMFSFQAMEMMKVSGSTFSSMNLGYQNYFNAFIRDKVNYSLKEDEPEEGAIREAIPYIIFLLFPIFIVLVIALPKGV
ncbi:PREDICTED: uncharacterized protein LOC109226185 [Nicotiana attenuata]|uniref:Uncharacterized protein n=1 Tax=Nicotiana attenuata TaxID=49451 RepID=A0A1J6IS87_NICAT|nr:PREDICTED: uncharacterized protein LOC109226185 [Nicotiana attenuata]OIT07116.1 hypothetical protein A4A49_32609 [Nicotiana attenuata]